MVDLNSNALITLANFKIYWDIDTSKTGEDNRIKLLINTCSKQFETAVGRNILADDYTEIYDGNGDDKLFVDHPPINTVTTIWDDPGRDYETEDIVDSEDYMILEDEGIVQMESGTIFSKSKQNLKITYNGGWATTPEDVAMAMYEWVAQRLAKVKNRRHGLSSDTEVDHTIAYLNEAIPKEVKVIIANYRLIGRQQMHRRTY